MLGLRWKDIDFLSNVIQVGAQQISIRDQSRANLGQLQSGAIKVAESCWT
jgi:hypothetical protein